MRAANPPTPQRRRGTVPRFLRYARPYLHHVLGATFFGVLKFTLPATTAIALRFMTDRLVAPAGTPPADFSFRLTERYLHWMAGVLPASWELTAPWGQFQLLMVTLGLVYGVFGLSHYLRSQLAAIASQRMVVDVRNDLWKHLVGMDHAYFAQKRSGAIVSRVMGDVYQAQHLIGRAMTDLWMDVVTCIFYAAVLFSMDARLAGAALLVFPAYILVNKRLGKASREQSKAVQEATEHMAGDLQECVAGMHVIKSFTAERREAVRFAGNAGRLYTMTVRASGVANLAGSLTQWLTQMGTLCILWYGGHRLLHGQVRMGVLVAFVLLLRELYYPVNRLSEMHQLISQSLAAIDRVFEVLDLHPAVRERPAPVALGPLRGELTLERVTFGYRPDQPVLRAVDLVVRPGETVALVGRSGAGKSTLTQLIPRFYDPQLGRVLVDGIDVRDASLASLRAQIGIVAQDIYLFSGSARDNIRYGRPDASDEEVLAATRAANAHDFISRLERGYDTVLGERGVMLSGGQRQRIAIARAFLGNPRVLILDEATSALDTESEGLIQEALAHLLEGRTSLVIAHRLTTVQSADRIVVLDDGRIVAAGRHRELMAQSPLYDHLYRSSWAPAPEERASA